MDLNATYHDLNGKSVFITGGGSGIGASLTEGFLRQGAKVAFVTFLLRFYRISVTSVPRKNETKSLIF